ncbi:MAG: TonB-dependent receptor [Ignavibacteriae bacterium]|nr:TonB-dependent receptor [Ignavibacteriota bacterium]
MLRSILHATLLLLLIPAAGFAQSTLRGTVRDSVTHETLVGANIHLIGTAIGGVTDREGQFNVTNIPAGTYRVRVSYVGYKQREYPTTFEGKATVTLNPALVPDVLEGNEVVITAQARGQVAAINQQITSSTIVNVISEEKIKEMPDANAAEAIGRLPGVSIIRSGGEANKVILRGMSDKFTSFTIDGVRIPPTDADSHGVDLSTFSQGTLAGIELFKALTPDKDADAIAGSINLVTRKAPEERQVRIDAKGLYSKMTDNLGQYDISAKYSERFFDNVLGVQVSGNLEQRDRSREQYNLSLDGTWRNYTDYYIDDLTLNFVDETRRRGGAGLLLDINTPEGGTIRINNMFSQTNRDYTTYGRNYPNGGERVYYSIWDREQAINVFNSSIRGDNMVYDMNVTWGLSFAQSQSQLPYDYRMQFSEAPSTGISGMRGIPESIWKGPVEQFIDYAYNNFSASSLDTAVYSTEKNHDRERTAFFDISRKVVLGDQLTWDVKVGGKYRYRTRFKESTSLMAPYYLSSYFGTHTIAGDGSIQPKNFAGSRFADLQLVGRLVLLTNFVGASPEKRAIFDRFSLNPLISKDALREWYELNKNGVSASGNQREYNYDPEAAGDYYDITERIAAVYLMNTFNVGSFATVIAGVRVEHETDDYNSVYSTSALSGFPVTGSFIDTTAQHSETSVLPNFHLTLRPTEFMNVRFAAYRALARPDFNMRLNKLVARITNPRNIVTAGNPDLKNAKAWNFEVNTSFFGNDIGLFTVSAFYRDIADMFHTVSNIPMDYKRGVGSILDTLGITWAMPFPRNSPMSLTYATNSDKPTKVWGFEVEHQANLSFLPGLLSNIVLSYNLSIIRSETFVLSYRTDTSRTFIPGIGTIERYSFVLSEQKQKLEGQPELFGNVAVGYDIGGFTGRLSVFFQGEYNRSYSASRRSDPVVQNFSRWDLSLKQRLTENISVLFNINNLSSIEEQVYTVNRDPSANWETLTSNQRYGLTADLGVRIEF